MAEGAKQPQTVTTGDKKNKYSYPKWAEFISAHPQPSFIRDWTWKNWTSGNSRPTLKTIQALSRSYSISETLLLHAAGYPRCNTVDELGEIRRSLSLYRKRERYKTDPDYRASVLRGHKDYIRRHPEKRRHKRVEHCNKTARRLYWEQTHNATPEERALLLRERKRLERQRARLRGYKSPSKWKAKAKPKSMAWIQQQFVAMRNRLHRVEMALSAERVKPWHWDACPTREEWRDRFPDKFREYQLANWKAKTYARSCALIADGATWTREQWIEVMQSFGYVCAYCGMHRREQRRRYITDLEADHVVPLSGGGTNHISNIVPACKGCNSSKSNEDMLVWAKAKGLTPHPLALERYSVVHRASTQARIA